MAGNLRGAHQGYLLAQLHDAAPERRPQGDYAGTAEAGRLEGRAFTLATELSITKQDGIVLTGEAAIAHPGETASAQAPATLSGFQTRFERLIKHYGALDQDQAAQDIDDFLDVRRGSKDLHTSLIEVDYRYDHDRTTSGLVVNEVGLSHLLSQVLWY